MNALECYPESCRWSIKTVADRLKIDYDEAYALISLNALLMDLYPSDTVVVRMVLEDAEAARKKRREPVS